MGKELSFATSSAILIYLRVISAPLPLPDIGLVYDCFAFMPRTLFDPNQPHSTLGLL